MKSPCQWHSPFSLMQIVFKFLNSCFLISFSFLVLVYFMAEVPVAKWVRCSIGTVCDACTGPAEKHLRLPMDLISIKWVDIWSARHAMFLMMAQIVHTWCPQHEWRCPPPCCKGWTWLDENTVQLHRGFQITYGVYVAYFIYFCWGN